MLITVRDDSDSDGTLTVLINAERLQSTNSFIFHESQLSVRPNLYIIMWQEPQKYLAVQLPVLYAQLLVLCLPINVQGLGNLPEVLCWAVFFFSSAGTPWDMLLLKQVWWALAPAAALSPPTLILLCVLQNLMRRHLLHMLHRLPPCMQVCAVWLKPTFAAFWGTASWNRVQKDKIRILPRQNFFPPLLPAC